MSMPKETEKILNENAEFLKALAHPVRLCIVRNLSKKGCANVTCMQDCLKLPQSTVSQHLNKLKSAGIIQGERNGLEIKYKVCSKKALDLIKVLFPEDV
ncbi:ArsR/SmtB family transcription factor [Haloimpatiens lingqiaonensis]|uniref:ArsR/SmtB family transcription factor n=1 Tax=Haloimpatiens lingqiaonensis TaxID=1380675 RepID=UPI001FAAF7E1|nr:metalloregulator ArsR/SmtB family transcription factor [Haloimpatiens lingqiaonensis]